MRFKIMKGKRFCAAASMALLCSAASAMASSQITNVNVETLQLRPDVYMLTVDDVNLVLESGPEGSVLVGSGPAHAAAAVLAKVKELSPKPLRFIINTSADPELTGGNATLSAAGQSMMIGYAVLALFGNDRSKVTGHILATRAPIVARLSVLEQMVAESTTPNNALALPSETFDVAPQYNFRINDEIVNVVKMPAAHSAGDSVVLFRKADVVVTGAIFDLTHFPVIDLAHGGSINGEIAAIDQVMNTLVVPTGPIVTQPNGTLVVPLRGRVCTQPDLLMYKDMLYAMRARVQDMIDRRMTLEQVQAAEPAAGYESRFGSETGKWTTRDFVAAVYKSLIKEGARPSRRSRQ